MTLQFVNTQYRNHSAMATQFVGHPRHYSVESWQPYLGSYC
jgi:hypothetical protein